jgi:hypothetical protein
MRVRYQIEGLRANDRLNESYCHVLRRDLDALRRRVLDLETESIARKMGDQNPAPAPPPVEVYAFELVGEYERDTVVPVVAPDAAEAIRLAQEAGALCGRAIRVTRSPNPVDIRPRAIRP